MERVLIVLVALFPITVSWTIGAHATSDGCAVVRATSDGFVAVRTAPNAASKMLGKLFPGQMIAVAADAAARQSS